MTSLRRKLALVVAGVAVATPLLSSCGFNYATDRPNTIANGGYNIDGKIHVLAARIVAPAEGTGTFVATITAEPGGQPATLTGLSGQGVTAGRMPQVKVQPQGMVNLFTDGGIPVTGSFKAGDSIPLKLTFDNGDTLDVNAVVVTQCHEYADVATPSAKPGRGSSSGSSPSASSSSEPYSCDYASVPPLGEGH